MAFEKADRLKALPPYLFSTIAAKKNAKKAAGFDVIDFGIGDPDRPTPKFIIDEMAERIYDPANHRYPFDEGVPTFLDAAATFMKKTFDVELDATSEILACIGSKDGIAHLPLAVVNPDDIVIVPQPCYPVYYSGAIFAGGRPFLCDLLEENGWLPDLKSIPEDVARQAKIIWVNYPNNPTAAVAPLSFYEELVAFAKKYDIIIASDIAYGETYFTEHPHSVLQVEGAKDVTIEFHSLSKTFNMTGWRLAFAAGNKDIVGALAQVKANSDSGQFNAVQWAGKLALDQYDHEDVVAMTETYRARRDALCAGLNSIGCEVPAPEASFFVWGKCPKGYTSMEFSEKVLEEANIVLVPGLGFAKHCDDYFRAALTVEVDRIEEAIERLKKIEW